MSRGPQGCRVANVYCTRNSAQWCIQNVPASEEWEHGTVNKGTGSWREMASMGCGNSTGRVINHILVNPPWLEQTAPAVLSIWHHSNHKLWECLSNAKWCLLLTYIYSAFFLRISKQCFIYYNDLSWNFHAIYDLFLSILSCFLRQFFLSKVRFTYILYILTCFLNVFTHTEKLEECGTMN